MSRLRRWLHGRLHDECSFCGRRFDWWLPYERLRRHELRMWFREDHGYRRGDAWVPRHRLTGSGEWSR